MKVVTREMLRWPAYAGVPSNTNKGLVAHYDGANQGLHKRHELCVTYWKNTRALHMRAPREWSEIGYSYGICPHGYVFTGRGYGRVQAAQKTDAGHLPDGNSRYTSVSFMTGPSERISDDAVKAFKALRRSLMLKYGLSGRVYGHNDFSSTSCPGKYLKAMVDSGVLIDPADLVRPALKLTQPWMRGKAVGEAQELLGFTGRDVDGIYGPKTANAVRRLKVAHNLGDNTICDSKTWSLLLKRK